MTEPPSLPPSGEEGDEEEIQSPFDTETVNYFLSERDRLAVALDGPPADQGELDLATAGPLLHRLNELIHALAAHVQSHAVGKCGKLPGLGGASGLAFAGITEGSAVLHFARKRAHDQLQISPNAEAPEVVSAMDEAVDLLLQIVSSSAANPEQLLDLLRSMPERIGTNYAELLDVLVSGKVKTRWQSDRFSATLGTEETLRARSVLDRQVIVEVTEDELLGRLYEANAKEHHFRLEVEGREVIVGEYAEELTDVIRAAWNRRVLVRLESTIRRLERSRQHRPADVVLLEVIEVFTDQDET